MNEIPPTDAWDEGVRASDVPIVNGGGPNPLDPDEFEATDAPLAPNKVDISRHLFELFSPAFVQPYPEAWIEVAVADPNAAPDANGKKQTGPRSAQHFSAFELEKAVAYAVRMNKIGRNVYVGMALRKGETGPSGRATKANAITASRGWGDFDKEGDFDKVVSLLNQHGLEVSETVLTGTIPHRRFQMFFKLHGKPTQAELEAVNEAIRDCFGGNGDDVQNCDRLMRLAGTVSYPAPDKVERGYVPELTTLHIHKDAPSYTVEHLTGLAGKTSNPFLRDFNNAAKPGRTDDALLALLEASRVAGQWHNSMRNAIATMIGRGWPDSAIKLSCAPYCKGGADDPDLVILIDGARKKWDKSDQEPGATGSTAPQQPQPAFEMFWHGKEYNRELRSWLVRELIPETGQGIAAGQWGTAKTFVVLDLAASIMTATPFAGREIARKGGVLFVAAEGASEIPIRLKGVVEQKLRPEALASGAAGQPISANLNSLPFAWVEDCPNLRDDGSFNRLVETAKQAAQNIRDQFKLPLTLIAIDTLNAAANFKDGNDAAEGQFIMNRLGELSRLTGAFVLAVDHFGKVVETGTRGTSAKEAAADVVLALLADREIAGTISNTRMALRKLRGGKVGTETPFNLKVVEIGDNETTCVVEWKQEAPSDQKSTGQPGRWPRSTKILKASLFEVLNNEGKDLDPFGDGKMKVKTVTAAAVRKEFMARYPADTIDPDKRADAKRQAFNRAMKQAMDRDLIGAREVGGVDILWAALLD